MIGWAGNTQAVVACLGGSSFVDTSGPDGGPGSNSTAAVTGTTYGYGVYDDSPTTWTNADGYLPALVTTFHRDGAQISITDFGDDVTIGGNAFVIIYSRVQVTNPTGSTISIDPEASAGLIGLDSAPGAVAPHSTVNHDYAVPSTPSAAATPSRRPARSWRPAASTSTSRTCARTGTGSWPRSRRSPRCPTRADRRVQDRLHLHPDHPERGRAEDRRQRLRQGVQPRRHRHPGQPVHPGLHR